MLTITSKKSIPSYLSAFIGLTYILIVLWLVPGYLHWTGNACAGLLLAPFICNVKKGQFSLRYLLPALLTVTVALVLPVRTTFFLALLFTMLLFIENSLGKLNEAFLFLMVLISPVFTYMTSLVDFPLRMWLSENIAALLNSSGMMAKADGNRIEMTDAVFSVDPACAGLHMLILSLIICLFLLMHHQRKLNCQFHFFPLIGIFLLTMGLNIVSNFFRILVLVTFKIMPGTLLHDLVGIVCLTSYVILPLITGIKPLLRYFCHTKDDPAIVETAASGYKTRYPWLHCSFIILLCFIAAHIVQADTFIVAPTEINLQGFKRHTLENGILKFESKQALIYIKPTAFYAPEHDPKICWTGSGYVFKSIKKERWDNIELYTAILEKGKDKIYAAWWFDNGKTQTTDQLVWRWLGIKGAHRFYLINVNAATVKSLQTQTRMLLNNRAYLN